MTVHPTSASRSPGPGSLDAATGALVGVGTKVAFATTDLLNSTIDEITRALSEYASEKNYNAPNLKSMSLDAAKKILNFHIRLLKFGGDQSKAMEENASALLDRGLQWLNFSYTTSAITNIITHKLPSLARIVTWAAIQVLHIVPWLAVSALITGTIFLYHSSPVGLITVFAGTLFSIQILQTFLLAKNAENLTRMLLDSEFQKAQVSQALAIAMEKGKNVAAETLNAALGQALGTRDADAQELNPQAFVKKGQALANQALDVIKAKMASGVRAWIETSTPISYYLTGPKWKRALAFGATGAAYLAYQNHEALHDLLLATLTQYDGPASRMISTTLDQVSPSALAAVLLVSTVVKRALNYAPASEPASEPKINRVSA